MQWFGLKLLEKSIWSGIFNKNHSYLSNILAITLKKCCKSLPWGVIFLGIERKGEREGEREEEGEGGG